MNPRAQHLLTRGGALTAAGLTFAALTAAATPAQAAPDWARDNLSPTKSLALSTANFWLDSNGAALKKATQYNRDAKAVTALVASRSQSVADGKAGAVAPIGGEKAATARLKNVNLPKTVGKVFFVDHKGEHRWCSATSIQSTYRNLVSTAGHCVYDIEGNRDVMDKWVFVPGYYQGKAPWGVYVGQAAFTHYNFAVHEDFDHDYAFVAVYNGLQIGGTGTTKAVTKAEYDKHKGLKHVKPTEIDKEEYDKCLRALGDCFTEGADTPADKVGPDYPGAVMERVEVDAQTYKDAAAGKGNGNKLGEPEVEHVTKTQYEAYVKGKQDKPADFPGTVSDAGGNYTITHHYVQKWIKPGTAKKYFKNVHVIADGFIKDVGRLGDNVGGQGFAWNQKTGQPVYAFGYPGEAHPDGDKPFTGVTMKYCYGKTNTRTYATNAYKIENHLALKCSMTGGADGGPWLVKYGNAKRLGYVNGVTSAFHDQDGNDRVDFVSSPYFDGDAAGVYREAVQVRNARIVGDKGELLK
ncbi:hypothetical protein HS048_32985 [Planomonospora sp. ID91781]|uniref:hypothetical protein n=1 Tax=Planomonospora sp. ID91781 TaxID=2738135 RepID=UPI0018C37DE7|nr:hypothetical protein [Planomonospora sp. ID91781]MBG0825508.1 hypothetical protein [Planomonospora sp. ID91781]